MISIGLSGATADAASRVIPSLIENRFASRLAAKDATLWGEAAIPEASIRLGWVNSSHDSLGLLTEIEDLRASFVSAGVTRFVLCGMGGSSLAPEVITANAGVDLVVLDSTHPKQVADVLKQDIEHTAVIVSSKSGSTVETDSQKRVFETEFVSAGIDPKQRIVIVTDPGSPLDKSAMASGYRVFNADPKVGGRYSALTAFGLVPSGLAGADIGKLLAEANEALPSLGEDSPANPALLLGAAMAATNPRRDKMLLLAGNSSLSGIGDWIEQLVAESTGKDGTGVLPVVAANGAAEMKSSDVIPVFITDEPVPTVQDSVNVSGPLGAQFVLWEFATAVAGSLLGINPFDQPDVEAAKVAARALLDGTPEPLAAFAEDSGISLWASGFTPTADKAAGAIKEFIGLAKSDSYFSIQAYANRSAKTGLEELRDHLAVASGGRPTTFGWGPRFLHSTGQYHKGGPAQGLFLQIVDRSDFDLAVPERPFGFRSLFLAQAQGDAQVLAAKGLPILTLFVDGPKQFERIIDIFRGLASKS